MIAGLLTSTIKTISASKQKSKKVDNQKLLPTKSTRSDRTNAWHDTRGTDKSGAIIVRPKASISSGIRVTNYKVASSDGGSGRGGALAYESLSKRLDVLVKNTNTLTQIAKDQYKGDAEDDKVASLNAQKVAQKTKEEKAEAKAEKKLEKNEFGLRKPKLNIFEGLFSTLQKLALGTAIMEFIRFFSDPKKSKPIFDFLDKHFTTIFISTIAALGAAVLAPLIGPGSILFGTLGLLGKGLIAIGGLLFALIKNLITTPTGLAFLAFGAGAWLPMVFPGLVNQKERETYKKLIEDYAGDKEKMIADLEKEKNSIGFFDPFGRKSEIDEQIYFLKTGRTKQYGAAPAGAQQLQGKLPPVPSMPEYTPGSYLPSPQASLMPEQTSQTLASAAASMKGFSSAAGPDGGKNGCVWAVNKVFDKAGLKTPWGKSNWVPDAEEAMIRDGYHSIEPGEQKGGDLYIAPGQKHVGIVLDNGNIISNSSTAAAFTWEATPAEYAIAYGGEGKYYRMPEQLKPIEPAGTSAIDEAAAISRSASYDEDSSPTIVPIIQPPPPTVSSSGGGTGPLMSTYNNQNQLNNYYRNQILGSLYRQ